MKRYPAAGVLAVLFVVLAGGNAGAEWIPSYYFFDRIAWSPDSRSLAVIGRYVNEESPETFEDTLLVDVETGEIRCLSPSMMNFVLSRDGKRMLFRGRWGLYAHEFATGVTRTVAYQNAFLPSEIAEYSFDREGTSAVCLRCSDSNPDVNGVYAYPLDGGEPVALITDTYCSPLLMNFWQKRRRGADPDPDRLPVPDRPVVVDNFPGTVWQIRKGLTPGVAVWSNGTAGSDTLCVGCRTAFVSWPAPGGQVLVATSPEDIGDLTSPGDLWLVRPSEDPVSLARGQFEKVGWRDDTHAVALARPGICWDIDMTAGVARPLSFSQAPDWLRLRRIVSEPVWTIQAPAAACPDLESARTASLLLRGLDVSGYALDGPPGAPVLSVGVFGDSAAAAAAVRRIREANSEFPTAGLRVVRRPASEMLGNFDFGAIASPDGRHTAFLRSHPHMFQPYTATEIWVEPGDGGRRRLLLPAMASW